MPGKKIIIESYTKARNDGTKIITFKNAKDNWNWIKAQDQWFLETTGIKEILQKYKVEYVNITEEVWQKRTVSAEVIKNIVENKYLPIVHSEFYSYIPKKLFFTSFDNLSNK